VLCNKVMEWEIRVKERSKSVEGEGQRFCGHTSVICSDF